MILNLKRNENILILKINFDGKKKNSKQKFMGLMGAKYAHDDDVEL